MGSPPIPASGAAAGPSYWLTAYREKPSLFLLLQVAEELCAAENSQAAAEAAGIRGQWLREQGEMIARISLEVVRDAAPDAVLELRALRRALSALGVSGAGWPVSGEQIADSLRSPGTERPPSSSYASARTARARTSR